MDFQTQIKPKRKPSRKAKNVSTVCTCQLRLFASSTFYFSWYRATNKFHPSFTQSWAMALLRPTVTAESTPDPVTINGFMAQRQPRKRRKQSLVLLHVLVLLYQPFRGLHRYTQLPSALGHRLTALHRVKVNNIPWVIRVFMCPTHKVRTCICCARTCLIQHGAQCRELCPLCNECYIRTCIF